jgi:hypothetical protein
MIQPRYTAETILGIKDPDATRVVRELGFANVAIGSVGASTIIFSTWVFPIAIVGGIFYAFSAARAHDDAWPDDAWSRWRYHRATLARLLAREGLVQQVADAYRAMNRNSKR